MSTDYKVFHAMYSKYGSYGYYKHIDCVVVAENESQAHTWAVMTHEDTEPSRWSFEEIDTSQAGCHYITGSES